MTCTCQSTTCDYCNDALERVDIEVRAERRQRESKHQSAKYLGALQRVFESGRGEK